MANQYAGRWNDVFLDTDSKLLKNTVFTVWTDVLCTVPATTYTDRTKSQVVITALRTDPSGMASFYVDPGVYWVKSATDDPIQREVHVLEDIADTADVAYVDAAISNATLSASAALNTHASDTTSIHGIVDTAFLETQLGAQAKADIAQANAETYADDQLESAGLASQSTLTNEINRATTAENGLANLVASVSGSTTVLIANETVRASGAETTITNSVVSASGSLVSLVFNETIRASGAETGLSNLVTTVSGGLTSLVANETSRASGAENVLSNGIVSASGGLAALIANETVRASGAEATVANSVVAVSGSVTTLDGLAVKTVNSVTPTSGAVQIPGVYRGAYTPGMVLYVNDVVNDSGFDRRVTIAHTAGASINLNNFASPASISADTLLGIASWTGSNVETDASHGFFPVRSRLRYGNRTKITRFRARTVIDLVTTSGSPNVSSTTAAFNASEAASGGGSVVIAVGVPNGAKILTYVDAQNVVLTSNATVTATGVTATISPDIATCNLPAQISSDADPIDPEGIVKMQASGFTANTVTSRLLSSTVDISNSIVRVGLRYIDAGGGSPRAGLKSCNLEVSSNNFADSNYKTTALNIRNEFRIGGSDIWDVVGCGPADWTASGTGASGNLASINAVRLRFDRDSGAAQYLSPAYVDYEPITNTKAKCVIWLDDGFTLHWTGVAPLLHSYGFRATIAPNVLEPTAMSPSQMRRLQDHYGWQVASHARTSAEHTTISGDALRRNLLASRHAFNSFGLMGADDFAWWGGLPRDLSNTREARKMFRTSRLATARIGETLPPMNPQATMAQQFLEGMSWTTDLQPWAQKAIDQKGVAQFVFHATTNTLAIMTDMCVWLNANRASIDVVTWEEAIRPYTYSA